MEIEKKHISKSYNGNKQSMQYAGAASGLKSELTDTIAGFDTLEHEWEELVEKAGGHVFQSFYWLNPWWKTYGTAHGLRIITFRHNRTLVGIAPLYLDTLNFAGWPALRTLRFIGSNPPESKMKGAFIDYSVSDFLDFIVHPEYEDQVAQHLLPVLRGKIQFDKIQLQETIPNSFTQRKLVKKLTRDHHLCRIEEKQKSPVLFIDTEDRELKLQEYINQRKSRRKLNRKMEAGKNFQVRCLESMEEVEYYFPICVQLYQSRWNEMGYPGTFYEPEHYGFMEKVIREKLKRGALWFIVAETDEGEVIAFDINMLQNRGVYVYVGSFDPSSKYRRFSPGNAVQLHGIKMAYRNDIRELHLLRGEESYKFNLTDETLINSDVLVYEKHAMRFSAKSRIKLAEQWLNIRNKFYRELTVMAIHRREYGFAGFPRAYLKSFRDRFFEKFKREST